MSLETRLGAAGDALHAHVQPEYPPFTGVRSRARRRRAVGVILVTLVVGFVAAFAVVQRGSSEVGVPGHSDPVPASEPIGPSPGATDLGRPSDRCKDLPANDEVSVFDVGTLSSIRMSSRALCEWETEGVPDFATLRRAGLTPVYQVRNGEMVRSYHEVTSVPGGAQLGAHAVPSDVAAARLEAAAKDIQDGR